METWSEIYTGRDLELRITTRRTAAFVELTVMGDQSSRLADARVEIDARRHPRRPLFLKVEVTERDTGRQAAGRMVEAKLNNVSQATFAYDGDELRIRKTTATTGAVTHYIYDGDGQLIAEMDGATGTPIRE